MLLVGVLICFSRNNLTGIYLKGIELFTNESDSRMHELFAVHFPYVCLPIKSVDFFSTNKIAGLLQIHYPSLAIELDEQNYCLEVRSFCTSILQGLLTHKHKFVKGHQLLLSNAEDDGLICF